MSGVELTVAVCSHRSTRAPSALTGCLSALARAGVVAPHVLEGGAPVSVLRNRALAACKTPVIVFVDDDVEVSRDWLDALSGSWKEADARVACIGGPISLAVRGERPAWLSDELASIAGLESGPGHSEDAETSDVSTFLGGNLSFRTDALAGVGGFWPVSGSPGLRDRFGEEHHAQRELARTGWQAGFTKAARGERVVAAGSLKMGEILGLKRLSSARRALIGSGVRADEVMLAARSLAGSAAAAARANRRLAAERLARAAGHYGAVTAARTASRTREPAAQETEFRFSVPAPTATAKRGLRGPEVLCLHRVTHDAPSTGLAVTPEAFADLLDGLLETRAPLTLEEALSGSADPSGFALTFDDGYADNLAEALPILEARGVPATFFIASQFVRSGQGFWWDEVARLLDFRLAEEGTAPVLTLQCGADRRSWAPRTPGEATEVRRHLNAWLQPQSPALIAAAVAQLRTWAGPQAPGPSTFDRPLTVDELRRLASHDLASIGAHTRNHPCLATTPDEALRTELAGCADDLEGWLGKRPTSIAYPFGVWGVDALTRTRDAAEQAGFSAGFVNGPGPNPPDRLAHARTGIAGY